ncbi:MAG: winged helix-turn-helix transcriptional regulator, partial [Erysipelothrix sp.]|nr:winged helix-turn-helix transcriptional regulator [Erysipelothrix sp.]
MNKNQFDVLVYLERNNDVKLTQRVIAEAVNLSIGTVNTAIKSLIEEGLVELDSVGVYTLSNKAYELLEPYKVKRAIFFAAGFGSRLVPVTYNTPKPLIRVNGVRMIDTLLDAVIAAGIEDITIVRGFLKEQFDTLLPKYPMLKFIDNDAYNEANNISSAYLVKDLFANTLILESDLILSDPSIIRKYEYTTNYRAKKVSRTDDWCFETKADLITKVKIGGEDVYEMVGISYW